MKKNKATTAYLNCASGIAGDMLTAALMEAFNVSVPAFEKRLKSMLRFNSFKFKYTVSNRYHAPVKHLDVLGNKHFHGPKEIHGILKKSSLPASVKDGASRILDTLVDAEAKVHRVKREDVHFHELNSVDTLIDITAPLLLLDDNGISRVLASDINIGNPAPATIEMLRAMSLPVYSSISSHELATPTGVAILSVISDGFGGMPNMTILGSGISCGSMDIPGHRNVLKAFIGIENEAHAGHLQDEVLLLSTNIDDMDPRIYQYVMDKLFALKAKQKRRQTTPHTQRM